MSHKLVIQILTHGICCDLAAPLKGRIKGRPSHLGGCVTTATTEVGIELFGSSIVLGDRVLTKIVMVQAM